MCSTYEASKTLFNFLFFLSHTFTEVNFKVPNTTDAVIYLHGGIFYVLDLCYFEMVWHVTGTKKNEEIKQ